MIDYYKTLGVGRTATEQEIKQAYRKLASLHHPDRGGDTATFQEIQAAYAVLGDEQKRREYDNPRPQHDFPGGFGFHSGPQGFDFDAVFNIFGQRFNDPRPQPTRVSLWISLRDVYEGGSRIIGIGNSNIEINLPVGVNDGENIRYPKLGPGGTDLIIQFRIKPDAVWTRQGNDIQCEASAEIWDFILGADMPIKNINDEELTVKLPERTQPNTTLRLRGRGFPSKQGVRGDLLIRMTARLPDQISPDIITAITNNRTN
jgi:curved DNA-binding protein